MSGFGILTEALARAQAGEGQVVGLSAPPGLGKSRLCFEFAAHCRTLSIPVLEARASIYGQGTPLQPVLEFLRSFFGIAPDDGVEATRERIARRLNAIDPRLDGDLPVLADFLGASEGARQPLNDDPKARHARLRQAFRNLVDHGGTSAAVILIEDLHWLDDASADFVAVLAEAVIGAKTLLVTNYRPSFRAQCMGLTAFRELELKELSPHDTGALVDELVGTHPTSHDLRRRIIEQCGGNPLFAEELARSLVDNGTISGDAGAYVASGRVVDQPLPATIQAVIGARIDCLSDRDKMVLQTAAIVGREFPSPVLQQLVELPAADLAAALGRLCEAELLHEQPGGGRAAYAFGHPLIHEFAYAMQLRVRRVALHASVARAIERYHEDRKDEFAALIAHHFQAAGERVPAAHYSARAARWIGTTDAREGLKHWRKVRLLLQDQPRSPELDILRMTAGGQIMNLGWREGMTAKEAAPFAEEALAFARKTANATAQMLLLAGYGRMMAATGSADAYVARLEQTRSLLTAAATPNDQTMLQAFLCHAYGLAGRLPQALAASATALATIGGIGKAEDQLLGFSIERWVKSLCGRILVRMGRYAEAEECLRSLLEREGERPDLAVQFIPHLAGVELGWLRHDPEDAAFHASRIAGMARDSGSPYLNVYAQACDGLAKLTARDHAGAIGVLRRALEHARVARSALEFEPEIAAYLAEAHRLAGDAAGAAAIATEAMLIARRRAARLAECRAAMTCARALASEGGTGIERRIATLTARARLLIKFCAATPYLALMPEPVEPQRQARAAARAV